eukprot:1380324-Pyramimonas_sp.AAC.1
MAAANVEWIQGADVFMFNDVTGQKAQQLLAPRTEEGLAWAKHRIQEICAYALEYYEHLRGALAPPHGKDRSNHGGRRCVAAVKYHDATAALTTRPLGSTR